MKFAAIYLSGLRDDGSMESALLNHARLCGFEPVEVYRDSDDAQGHPQLDRMLQDAGEREIVAVVTGSLEHLAQSPGQLVEVLGKLMERGLGLIAKKEGLDTTTHDAGVILKVITAVVELQRRAVLSTATPGRQNRPGRPRLELDFNEVKRLHANGLSVGQLAKHFKCGKTSISRAIENGPEGNENTYKEEVL